MARISVEGRGEGGNVLSVYRTCIAGIRSLRPFGNVSGRDNARTPPLTPHRRHVAMQSGVASKIAEFVN